MLGDDRNITLAGSIHGEDVFDVALMANSQACTIIRSCRGCKGIHGIRDKNVLCRVCSAAIYYAVLTGSSVKTLLNGISAAEC